MILILASNNQHKLQEVRHILGADYDVRSLADIGLHADIPETGTTLQENALQKARYVRQWLQQNPAALRQADLSHLTAALRQADQSHLTAALRQADQSPFPTESPTLPCVFADDTGLEVEALGGAPGVYTARYAGEHCSPEDNIDKLLAELQGKDNRHACFRTSIALVLPSGEEHLFDGLVEGTIAPERQGKGGFGYDPVFHPDGFPGTFAQLGQDMKDHISHRARATQALATFLHALPRP